MLKQSTRVHISRDICVCFTRYLLSSIAPTPSGQVARKPLGSASNLNVYDFKCVAATMNLKLGTQCSYGNCTFTGLLFNFQIFVL